MAKKGEKQYYGFGKDAAIEYIRFEQHGDGMWTATLYANKNPDVLSAQPDLLGNARQYLEDNAVRTIPLTSNDTPALRVEGFKNPDDLMRSLHKNGFLAAATGAKISTPFPNEPKTDSHQFKKMAGLGYAAGDFFLIAKGLYNKDFADLMTGLAFAVATVEMAVFGERDPHDSLISVMEKFDKEMEKVGIPKPKAGEVLTEERLRAYKPGIATAMGNILRDYPGEIFSLTNTVGGLMAVQGAWSGTKGLMENNIGLDALTKNSTDGTLARANAMRWVSGLGITLGCLAGWMLPQKLQYEVTEAAKNFVKTGEIKLAQEPVDPSRKSHDRFNPASMFGVLNIINNFARAGYAWTTFNTGNRALAGTVEEKVAQDMMGMHGDKKDYWKENVQIGGKDIKLGKTELKNYHIFALCDFLAVVSYFSANMILTFGNMNTGVEGGEDMKAITGYMASQISRLPEENRKAAVAYVVDAFAGKAETAIHPQKMKDMLLADLEELGKNPFMAQKKAEEALERRYGAQVQQLVESMPAEKLEKIEAQLQAAAGPHHTHQPIVVENVQAAIATLPAHQVTSAPVQEGPAPAESLKWASVASARDSRLPATESVKEQGWSNTVLHEKAASEEAVIAR